MGGHFAGHDVQRRLPVENAPGKSNTVPGRLKKCSASARNRVHLHPGMVFRISPEFCSASSRNSVQLRPDSRQSKRDSEHPGYKNCGVKIRTIAARKGITLFFDSSEAPLPTVCGSRKLDLVDTLGCCASHAGHGLVGVQPSPCKLVFAADQSRALMLLLKHHHSRSLNTRLAHREPPPRAEPPLFAQDRSNFAVSASVNLSQSSHHFSAR